MVTLCTNDEMRSVDGKKIVTNNRDIVPYNPYVLFYFQAHINAEVCSSVKSVKYKYVYKGQNCCNLIISKIGKGNSETENDKGELNHDEINMFLSARRISHTKTAYSRTIRVCDA